MASTGSGSSGAVSKNIHSVCMKMYLSNEKSKKKLWDC